MKTEKSDAILKAEMIDAFSRVIDTNTKSCKEVWSLLHALQDVSEFADDKRYKFPEDLPSTIRLMREHLLKDSPGLVTQLDEITDDIQAIIMLSGANCEGLSLLNAKKMREDLFAVSDQFNS